MGLTRVLLVDDDEAVRDGVNVLLSTRPDFEVVGETDNRVGALRLIESAKPDVVLLDIRIPGDDGLSIAGEIRTRFPHARVVIFSAMQYRKQEVKLQGLKFILKGCDRNELIAALKAE